VKSAAFFFALALFAAAQSPSPVKYECTPDDIEQFGLSCPDDQPCPVFLELSAAESNGARLFVTGNLHTHDTTLYALLLASADNGATWTEPVMRIRSAVLDQIEFFDAQTGWISGASVEPLSGDAFFLITADGGVNWRRKPVFDDSKFGVIAQFHFESRNNGQMILDASQGKTVRQELYRSATGGESWELQETSNKPIALKTARPASQWRVRADAPSRSYRIERGSGRNWQTVATFPIQVGECRQP
jgi:photosystem II stability/assembly factor-like uncharacterized protein